MGISISFNSGDKATQGEVKQDQNAKDKTTEGEAKQDQNAEDKSKVIVNITNETPQTQDKTNVVVIRDPIPVQVANGGFVFPNSNCTYLTQSQVSGLSNYQLGIARNEIYARHGYIFSLEQFRTYFSAQSWYTPVTKNVTLNSIESYNVNLIKAEEERRGIVWK